MFIHSSAFIGNSFICESILFSFLTEKITTLERSSEHESSVEFEGKIDTLEGVRGPPTSTNINYFIFGMGQSEHK